MWLRKIPLMQFNRYLEHKGTINQPNKASFAFISILNGQLSFRWDMKKELNTCRCKIQRYYIFHNFDCKSTNIFCGLGDGTCVMLVF